MANPNYVKDFKYYVKTPKDDPLVPEIKEFLKANGTRKYTNFGQSNYAGITPRNDVTFRESHPESKFTIVTPSEFYETYMKPQTTQKRTETMQNSYQVVIIENVKDDAGNITEAKLIDSYVQLAGSSTEVREKAIRKFDTIELDCLRVDMILINT